MYYVIREDIRYIRRNELDTKIRVVDETDLICEEMTVREFKNIVKELGVDKFRHFSINHGRLIYDDISSVNYLNSYIRYQYNTSILEVQASANSFSFLLKRCNKLISINKGNYSEFGNSISNTFVLIFINHKTLCTSSKLDTEITFKYAYILPDNKTLRITIALDSIKFNETYLFFDLYISLNSGELLLIRVSVPDDSTFTVKSYMEYENENIDICFDSIKYGTDVENILGYIAKLNMFGSRLVR